MKTLYFLSTGIVTLQECVSRVWSHALLLSTTPHLFLHIRKGNNNYDTQCFSPPHSPPCVAMSFLITRSLFSVVAAVAMVGADDSTGKQHRVRKFVALDSHTECRRGYVCRCIDDFECCSRSWFESPYSHSRSTTIPPEQASFHVPIVGTP